MTFIRWMTAPERAAAWSIETGYMGVSHAAYETDALKSYVECNSTQARADGRVQALRASGCKADLRLHARAHPVAPRLLHPGYNN